jgi:hypothetical protein
LCASKNGLSMDFVDYDWDDVAAFVKENILF